MGAGKDVWQAASDKWPPQEGSETQYQAQRPGIIPNSTLETALRQHRIHAVDQKQELLSSLEEKLQKKLNQELCPAAMHTYRANGIMFDMQSSLIDWRN